MSEFQDKQPENSSMPEALQPMQQELISFFANIMEVPAQEEGSEPTIVIPKIKSVTACEYAYGVTQESLKRFEEEEGYQPPKGLEIEMEEHELPGNHYFRQLHRLEQVAGLLGDYLAVYREHSTESDKPRVLAKELGLAQGIHDDRRAEMLKARLYERLTKELLNKKLIRSIDHTSADQAEARSKRIYAIADKREQRTAGNVALLHDAVVQDGQRPLTFADFEIEVAATKAPEEVEEVTTKAQAEQTESDMALFSEASEDVESEESQRVLTVSAARASGRFDKLEQDYKRVHGVSIGDNTKAARILEEIKANTEAAEAKGYADIKAILDGAKAEHQKKAPSGFSRIFRNVLNSLRPNRLDSSESTEDLTSTEQKPVLQRAFGAIAVRLFNRPTRESSVPSVAHMQSESAKRDLETSDKKVKS